MLDDGRPDGLITSHGVRGGPGIHGRSRSQEKGGEHFVLLLTKLVEHLIAAPNLLGALLVIQLPKGGIARL